MRQEKKQASDRQRINGVGLSPGIGLGKVYHLSSPAAPGYRWWIQPDEIEAELQRFDSALVESIQQLESARTRLGQSAGRESSSIIETHMLMLQDRQFLSGITRRIRDQLETPERATENVSEAWLSRYRCSKDPFFKERGGDFEEVVHSLMSNLLKLQRPMKEDLEEDVILVAPELSLSVLACYPLNKVKGLVLSRAGRTSHLTIIARSYQIPIVSGVSRPRRRIAAGQIAAVDGTVGAVDIGLRVSELEPYRKREAERRQRRARMKGDRERCLTQDGRSIHLYANLEIADDFEEAARLGAEGIGLFRSEYGYLRQRSVRSSAAAESQVYERLAEQVGERPAIIRTLDLSEEGHVLLDNRDDDEQGSGLRGIRFSLRYPDMLRRQIRAILRARSKGNLQVVLPMIATVEEVVQARAIISEVAQELQQQGRGTPPVSVGVMIEVPAAVIILDSLAPEADFMAVGTNDLIQYMMAADRTDDSVDYLHSPFHPAVLKSLAEIAATASRHELTTYVCGEVAAEPVFASILVGMGFQHLSMNCYRIPALKEFLRRCSWSDLQKKVERLLDMQSSSEIEAFVLKEFGRFLQEDAAVNLTT